MTRRKVLPLLAAGFIVCFMGLVFVLTMADKVASVGGSVPVAEPSAPVTPKPSAKPSPATPTTAKPTTPPPAKPIADGRCPKQLPPVVYYANSKNKVAGPESFGPSLVPAGLNPRKTPSLAQALSSAKTYWQHVCSDIVLADGNLAGFDPTFNPSGGMSRADVLTAIARKADWTKPRLRYGPMPSGSWTYNMIPGKVPTLYASPYAHGADWFLVVKLHNGHEVFIRLKCGLQPTFPKVFLDHHIPLRH